MPDKSFLDKLAEGFKTKEERLGVPQRRRRKRRRTGFVGSKLDNNLSNKKDS